jgi:hypothetical protein
VPGSLFPLWVHFCISRYSIINIIISRPNIGKKFWKNTILLTKDFWKKILEKPCLKHLNLGVLKIENIKMYHQPESSCDPDLFMVIDLEVCPLLVCQRPLYSI